MAGGAEKTCSFRGKKTPSVSLNAVSRLGFCGGEEYGRLGGSQSCRSLLGQWGGGVFRKRGGGGGNAQCSMERIFWCSGVTWSCGFR